MKPGGRWDGAEPCSLQAAERCPPFDEDVPDAAGEVAEGTWIRGAPELEELLPILPPLPPAGPGACHRVLQLIIHVQPQPGG